MLTLRTTNPQHLRPPALPGDVGYNLRSVGAVLLLPGGFARVPTGVRVQIPEGYFGLIVPRSGTNLSGDLLVLTGVIDNGYRGELYALVHNLNHSKAVGISEGAAVCQLVLLPCCVFPIEAVLELSDTDRGANGFGSTGA